jgi:hypothetical protein
MLILVPFAGSPIKVDYIPPVNWGNWGTRSMASPLFLPYLTTTVRKIWGSSEKDNATLCSIFSFL